MLTVTKTFDFCYGHKLPNYKGPCVNQHGHNSTLEVEVEGQRIGKAPEGMICDFSYLKEIVEQNIIDVLDHTNINDMLLPDDDSYDLTKAMILMPTAENIVLWIANVLEFDFYLVRVRLYETPTSYAEWRKD